MRVALADREQILREGVEAVLRREDDIEVVGSFSTGQELLNAVDALRPDAVVLAAHLPDISGGEVIRQIKREHPNTCAIILTYSHAEADLVLAVEAGADAYMCKECSAEDLQRAIRHACTGSFHISPCVAGLMRGMVGTPDGDTLTTREIEVLFALKDGLTTEEIATRLMLSPSTVKTHLRSIYGKYEVRNRVEAVREARERGVIGRL